MCIRDRNQTGQFVSCLEDKLFQPAGFNWRAKYDKGNLVEKVYLNNVKEPYLNPNEGYAKYIAKYNERGRLIELSFFDTEEKPCLNNKGYAKVSYGYDEWGNVTEILFLGVDGKPCTDSSGVAPVSYTHLDVYKRQWGYWRMGIGREKSK